MMNAWIVDVLADLRAFADNNGLAALSDQLDRTTRVAVRELAIAEAAVAGGPVACEGLSRSTHRQDPARKDAR